MPSESNDKIENQRTTAPEQQADQTRATQGAVMRAPMQLDGHLGPIAPFMPSTTEELVRLVGMMCRGGLVPKAFEHRDGPQKGQPDQEKMVVAILAGREVGFGPVMSLRSVMVVGGMPSVWGAGAKALVLRSGLVTDYRKQWIDSESIKTLPGRLPAGTPPEVVAKMKAEHDALGAEGFMPLYLDGDDVVVAKHMKLPPANVPTGEWPKELACLISVRRRGVTTPYVGQFGVGDARRAGLWEKIGGMYSKYPQDMLEHRAAARAYDRGFSDCLMGMAIRELIEDREEDKPNVADAAFLQTDSATA